MLVNIVIYTLLSVFFLLKVQSRLFRRHISQSVSSSFKVTPGLGWQGEPLKGSGRRPQNLGLWSLLLLILTLPS
jgi:hypothetical protein